MPRPKKPEETPKSQKRTRSPESDSSFKKSRSVTSAIPGMSGAEVRKGLAEIRRRFREQEPMYLTDPLWGPDLTVQDFCLKFICGHHEKRHSKAKSSAKETSIKSSESFLERRQGQ